MFHIAARTVSAQALSIFGDHSDVMACRSTGFGMLMSSSPQEVMDLAAISHLSAIGGKCTFMCFDGFRTSHEMQRIESLDYEYLKRLVDYHLNALKEQGVAVEAIDAYLVDYNDGVKSREVADNLLVALEQVPANEDIKFIFDNKEYLAKKSVWAFGGDGWAYNIGHGRDAAGNEKSCRMRLLAPLSLRSASCGRRQESVPD